MLINLTNHPYALWDDNQKKEAGGKYGVVRDLSFPRVNPHSDEKDIARLAKELFNQVQRLLSKPSGKHNEDAVHIQGEFTLVFALVSLLLKHGIKCIASTTERKVAVQADGTKISRFSFVRFREYKSLE